MDFDDHEYAAILIKEKVEVKFVGEDEWAHWGMRWRHGGLGFTSLDKPEDEEKARKAAALFIYLWNKGVRVDLAERCAEAYVLTWKISLIGPEDSKRVTDKIKGAIASGNVHGGILEDGAEDPDH